MSDNDVFCLRLHDFDINVKNSSKQNQSQKDFCDVTLECDDDKQIETHKFIISSSSPVFRNILKQNPNQHQFIYLRRVKYKDLSNLINFMYQGEVNISQEELNSFLAVAEDLKITLHVETSRRQWTFLRAYIFKKHFIFIFIYYHPVYWSW